MSMPFYGQHFSFTQPDGTQLEVRGWGDQHYAAFETTDGYSVVKNPTTGFYDLASLNEDGDELVPLGAPAGALAAPSLGLKKSIRIKREAAKAKAMMSSGLPSAKSRWNIRRKEARQARFAESIGGIMAAPPQRYTVGDFAGLCLLVQFPDVPGTTTREQVEAFCNQPSYNGFGNHGSVFDYFQDVSGGKLRYRNVVTPYYTAKHPRAYYTNPKVKQPTRTYELIKEALTYWKSKGFDFTTLTADSSNYIYAVNVFYAGTRVNNWSEGLWPHSYHLQTAYPLAAGKNAYDYQITDMGSELSLGTFCHENGHMICDFPDLYDYGYESRGVGVYCLMCAGGVTSPKNPTHVGAYLKYRAGWAEKTTTVAAGDSKAVLEAGKNDFLILSRSKSEYFIIENRLKIARDLSLPGSGIAIWHVDELGSNNNEQMSAISHYECALVQADNKSDLEHGINDGDPMDLFSAATNARFADATLPHSKWWDGSTSNLDIDNIAAAGQQVSLTIKL